MVVHALVEMMHTFCHLFGRPFVQKNVKPSFLARLALTEEEKSKFLFVNFFKIVYYLVLCDIRCINIFFIIR